MKIAFIGEFTKLWNEEGIARSFEKIGQEIIRLPETEFDARKVLKTIAEQKPDLVLLDIKEFNPEHHQSLTGRSNEQTLKTAAWLEANQKPFWLRYVLVPGYSDFEDDIRQLGEHLGTYRMIQRVEILPYHTLGVHKYEAMDKEYLLKGVKENTPEQIEKAEKLFRQYFRTVQVN